MATTSKAADPAQVLASARELTRENSPDSPIVQQLRRQVANAFVLYTNYKHYHWQTFGPQFRDLHPPAHPMESVDLASVAPAVPYATMRDMIEEADRHALVVVSEMRRAAKLAEEHGDPGTVDLFSLFSRTVQIHEKHEWWLRDILRTGDGLRT